MNNIDIIDVLSKKWYTINATGTTPEHRRRFCGGVASAQDGSSHNIYIYGGMGFGNQTDGFDDVYILTIPTFTWIKAWPDRPRKPQEVTPHHSFSCDVVRDSQMLIIGGIFPQDTEITKVSILLTYLPSYANSTSFSAIVTRQLVFTIFGSTELGLQKYGTGTILKHQDMKCPSQS